MPGGDVVTGKKLVIVHGVQSGDDISAVQGPTKMAEELESFLDGRAEFTAEFPAYESLNEEHQEIFRTISKLLLSRISRPVGMVFDKLVDVVGDVYVYERGGAGKEIRSLIRNSIERNRNCILIAHSLGSVVCFDILNNMMKEGAFKNKTRDKWPVRSFITFGSPLALDMFRKRRVIAAHGGKDLFHWYNYSDRNDPVISGHVFGKAFIQNDLMRDTYKESGERLRVHDRQVDTGFHLLSHVNYWQNEHIIMRIADQLS
jgi:hypothetical protein